LLKPSVWRSLLDNRPQVRFLVTALALTYPTVWLAAGARGRYYMPLYPCLAVLIGLVIEHCAASCANSFERVAWRRFLRGLAGVILTAGVALTAISFVPGAQFDAARQTVPFLIAWLTVSALIAGALVWAAGREQSTRPQLAVAAVAVFMALAHAGAVVNSRIHITNDLTPAIAQLKAQLPDSVSLVSFNRVYHRFAYEYGAPIRQTSWPATAADVPGDLAFFCFDHHPGELAQTRDLKRMPFAWDVVAEISCDPLNRTEPPKVVVIGRVRGAGELARPSTSRLGLR
jgi:hypothetical protein